MSFLDAPVEVPVSAIRLRRSGNLLEVLAEVDEIWRVVISEEVPEVARDFLDETCRVVEKIDSSVNALAIYAAPRDWNAGALAASPDRVDAREVGGIDPAGRGSPRF